MSRGEERKIEIDQRKENIVQKIPPSLKEIEKGKNESEENEDDKKRELMFKLQLIQKQYPTKPIPEFTIRSEYKTMKKTYDIIVKQLSVDSSVDSYKTYLVGGFMVCEMVFGKIGFEMEGFTQQQLLTMNSYEKLLIELGEKTYTPAGMEKWSVEVRLALAILFNAVWFIAAKMIMNKTKIDILSLVNVTTKKGNSIPSSSGPSPLNFSKMEFPKKNTVAASSSRKPMMKGPSNTRDEGIGSGDRSS
jgi:hypothetical protein